MASSAPSVKKGWIQPPQLTLRFAQPTHSTLRLHDDTATAIADGWQTNRRHLLSGIVGGVDPSIPGLSTVEGAPGLFQQSSVFTASTLSGMDSAAARPTTAEIRVGSNSKLQALASRGSARLRHRAGVDEVPAGGGEGNRRMSYS